VPFGVPRRRIVLPGQVLAVSRRTTRRYHLFVPDMGGETERIFWYCLAIAAASTGVEVHVAILMSNHVHLVITDVRGVAPDFFREFHRLLALCTKAKLGWPEEVFNKSKTGAHELVTCNALIDSCGYAIANPSSALLVRRASEWPGARTSASDMGTRVVRVERPKYYFRGTQWPDVVELRITVPKMLLAEMEPEEVRRRVQERVRFYEKQALAEAKATGRRFLGARRAQRVSVNHRASSYEPFGARDPRFAAGGDHEAARAVIARNRQFDEDYDAALAGWCAGDRAVVFPAGTWWMRVHHGARCRPPP